MRKSGLILLAFCLLTALNLPAQIAEELKQSLVYVEAMDSSGQRTSLGMGFLVKNGFIATNYHLVAGNAELFVTPLWENKIYKADGYLGVNEEKDLIVVSVPKLKGRAATLSDFNWEQDSVKVRVIESPAEEKKVEFRYGRFRGKKEIRGLELIEIESTRIEECTNGPVFYGDKIVGLATAGYYDGKYYLFAVPAKYLRPLLTISFIIKSFDSLQDSVPLKKSRYHAALIESLTDVLWMPFNDAVKLAQKKKRKIILDVYTDWCGWCKLMKKNTYSKTSIIRYINENYYAVRLNAEGNDSIFFKGQLFTYDSRTRSHELAYSLLNGKMSYPSTVFLDDKINLLTVVPGYIDPVKTDVILHYFSENAYLDPNEPFEKFEESYLGRKEK